MIEIIVEIIVEIVVEILYIKSLDSRPYWTFYV